MNLNLVRKASLLLNAVMDEWDTKADIDEETERMVRIVVQMLVQIVEGREEERGD